MLVQGETGIGKTRLVREALANPALGHRRILVGHCQPLCEPFLLAPIVEALQGLQAQLPRLSLGPVGGALRSLLPELVPMLPEDHAPVTDPRAQRHRLFRALRELLDALGPTVCVLEDLQWADRATLEFLEFLLPRFPEELVIIVTYRGEEVPPASLLAGLAARPARGTPLTTIELEPLSDDDVQALVGAILGSELVSKRFARCLRARTGGVPLGVEEVMRLLDDRDRFALAGGGRAMAKLERAGVPPAVQQSIRERMSGLTDDACLVTRAAGVLGAPVEEELVAAVAGLTPARAARALNRALQYGPLEEKSNNLYGFRHPLAAQAACDDTPGPQRRRMHQRAAHALAGNPQTAEPARLAHHFKEAGRWSEWVGHAEAAAAAASRAGDDRSAADLLEQALCAPEISQTVRIRMTVQLGYAAIASTSPETAISLLQQALAHEWIPDGIRGELRFCLARLCRNAQHSTSWRKHMARAVAELRGRPELAARAMSHLAHPELSSDSLEENLRWLRRAADEATRSTDPLTNMDLLAHRAAVLLSVGDPAGWQGVEEIPCEAGSLEGQVERLHGYRHLSVVSMELGHHERAESLLAASAGVAEKLHLLDWDPWHASAQLALDWRTGRWDGLEERARDLVRATGNLALISNQVVLGSLLATRGQVEEAEHLLTAAARRRTESRTDVWALATLAGVVLDRGDASAAHELIAPPLHAIQRKGMWAWAAEVAPIAVRALLARGELNEAQGLTAACAAGLHGRDAPAARAAHWLCKGAVAEAQGRYDVAASLFDRAERAWDKLPAPYQVARAREARARCLLARNDKKGGQLLVGALETFETMGASTDASRVRAQVKAQGIALPSQRRGGRRAYGNQLSPREAEVARLAGAGLSNREIAQTLFISTRTVEAHVASALRKVGVKTRHALAGPQAARALGDPPPRAAAVWRRP